MRTYWINAQAELAENIKVTILSIAELVRKEKMTGTTYTTTESFTKKIISIGNATVRTPEYKTLYEQKSEDGFQTQVLVLKLKKEHIQEAARDLGFNIDIEALIN